MNVIKFSWKNPLLYASAAALMWLSKPPAWTFHYYLIHFFREQAHNRMLLEDKRVGIKEAEHMYPENSLHFTFLGELTSCLLTYRATQDVPVRINDNDIVDLVCLLKPRVWNFVFFQFVKVRLFLALFVPLCLTFLL